MKKEQKFAQELEADIKKKTLLMSLERNNGDMVFLPHYKLLKNVGFNLKSSEELLNLTKHIISLDDCGKYLTNYNCLFENTMFYLHEENKNITQLNFAYLNTNTANVNVCWCDGKNLICKKEEGIPVKFETLNQNEFDGSLAGKDVVISASCFANNVVIKQYCEKNEKLKEFYREIDANNPMAQLSGIITSYRKILNKYTSNLFDEICIDCFGINIAVVLPSGLVEETKIKIGNILVCSGLLTSIVLNTDSRAIDNTIVVHGRARLKNYLVCITKNKNAIVILNTNKNGEINDRHTYVFPTRNIKTVILKPCYNGLFNYYMKIVVNKGKNFGCYLMGNNYDISKLLNSLDVDIEM